MIFTPFFDDQKDGRSNHFLIPTGEEGEKYSPRLSEEDYNFWRHLAREYYQKEELKIEEKHIIKKEWEAVQTISEEIEHEKKWLRQLKVSFLSFYFYEFLDYSLEKTSDIFICKSFSFCYLKVEFKHLMLEF